MSGDPDTSFVIVDDDEEQTDFELVDVPQEVELVRVTDPVPGLVPVEEETGFVIVEDPQEETSFELIEQHSSPSIVPVPESRLQRHGG